MGSGKRGKLKYFVHSCFCIFSINLMLLKFSIKGCQEEPSRTSTTLLLCNILLDFLVDPLVFQQHVVSVQFSSVTQSCPLFVTPWTAACQASLYITNSQSLPKLTSIELVDAIQPSHLLSSPSPPAFNLAQHQGLF